LLEPTGLRFAVRPAGIPEHAMPGEDARSLVERLAEAKARAIAERSQQDVVVLGSDTAVVLDGDILGKPRDPEHAVALLRRLTGRTHRVLTGVALVSERGARADVLSVESRVAMRSAAEEELRAYVATGESLDKAGAYALQGEGRRFIEYVEGSESNVIGLPLDETCALLRELGFSPRLPEALPEAP
jgi:septum formation protein